MMRIQLNLFLMLFLCAWVSSEAQEISDLKTTLIGSYLTYQREGSPFEWHENGSFFRHRVQPKIAPGFYISKDQSGNKSMLGIARINLTRHEEPVRVDSTADFFPAHGPISTTFELALFYNRLWKIHQETNQSWSAHIGMGVEQNIGNLKMHPHTLGRSLTRIFKTSSEFRAVLQVQVRLAERFYAIGGYSLPVFQYLFSNSVVGLGPGSAAGRIFSI